MKTLLKNANIYELGVCDILVEDGIITEIGSIETADTVVDLSDYAAVLPGFIDAHMHIVTGDIEYNDRALKSWAQSGVTTVRDLGIGNDRNDHPTEEFLAYRETIETPECAHCLTCGRFVTQWHGYSHIMSDGAETGFGCKTPEDCRTAVNHLIDIGCEGIKTAVDKGSPMFGGEKPLLTVEQLRSIAQAADERGVWCCAHVLEAELIPMLLEAGIPEFCHMPTDRVPDALLEKMVAQGITVVPTLCTINAPRPPLPEGAELPPMPPMPEGMTPPEPVDTLEQEKICVDNVRRFVEKGGMVAVGTDTMRMESQPHVATMPIRELQLLHEAGLSIPQVIDAATINAAKVCKIDDSVGSIAIGKQANIIAVRSPIDETFDSLSHVEFVMNRGCVIKG